MWILNEYGEDPGDRLLEHAACEGIELEDLVSSLETKAIAAKHPTACRILFLLARRVEDHLEMLAEDL